MAECPECNADATDMTLEPTGRLIASRLGDFSLAGAQMKTTARHEHRLSCRCGWAVTGYVSDGALVVLRRVDAEE